MCAQLLTREIAGMDVYWHAVDTCTSTIELCGSLLAEAPDDIPVVVVAGHQTSGRGRFDRTWVDTAGSSALVSIGRRTSMDSSLLSGLPLAMAEALRRALTERAWIAADAAAIKPPNDLLVHGDKVAGLLANSQSSGGDIDQLILSCGLNVRGPASTIEGTPATTLEALGTEVAVDRAAEVVIEALLPALA